MIPVKYDNGVAVLIGSGPSLTARQVALCKQPHQDGQLAMMGCNDAYRICPFLDVLYAADGKWIDYHRQKILEGDLLALCTFWTPDEKAAANYREWNLTKIKVAQGLSTDPSVVHHGNHSGYQIINVAYLMGCRTIILIGYDCRDGGKHWFGQHPWGPLRVESNFDSWAKGYNSIAEQASGLDLRVFNATPGSGISAFPMVDLEEALHELTGRGDHAHTS